MNRYVILLTLFFYSGSIFGQSHCNYYVIDGNHEYNSVIKIWFTVLGLLDDYENGLCSGFEISFNQNGRHFDAARGPNWWQYYFAFQSVLSGEKNQVIRLPRYKRSIIRFKTVCTMSPERGNYLINKYMILQSSILTKLQQIKCHYWPSNIPVVGIYCEKPIMPDIQQFWDPSALCARVKSELKEFPNCRICLFTNLEEFEEVFKREFPVQYTNIPYFKKKEQMLPVEYGEYELLTLLLLSQCDLVIASGSYHSIGARMLNPKLKVIELDIIPYARE